MKIIATDYDESLLLNDYIRPDVFKAIDEWRAAGNLFGINTARSYPSINFEVQQLKIPFDFLVCGCGVSVVDGNRQAIASEKISEELTGKIIDAMLRFNPSTFSIVDDTNEWCVCEDGWCEYQYHTHLEKYEVREKVKSANALLCLFFSLEDRKACVEYLKTVIDDPRVMVRDEGCWCECVLTGYDKASGMRLFLDTLPEKVDDRDVFTFGDGEQDIPMIKAFNGCSLPHACKGAREAAKKIYNDVSEIIRENL